MEGINQVYMEFDQLNLDGELTIEKPWKDLPLKAIATHTLRDGWWSSNTPRFGHHNGKFMESHFWFLWRPKRLQGSDLRYVSMWSLSWILSHWMRGRSKETQRSKGILLPWEQWRYLAWDQRKNLYNMMVLTLIQGVIPAIWCVLQCLWQLLSRISCFPFCTQFSNTSSLILERSFLFYDKNYQSWVVVPNFHFTKNAIESWCPIPFIRFQDLH